MCAIAAGILTGLAAMLTASAKFKQFFSALCYAKLITIPAMLLALLIVTLRGVDSVNSMMDIMWTLGPAMFITDNKMLFNILTQFNLFEAWYVVLLVLAVQKISGAKRGSAITVVAIYWVIGAAAQIGMLMLSGLK
jgi:ABC-type antimicrobial peptide transport system permease subunit